MLDFVKELLVPGRPPSTCNIVIIRYLDEGHMLLNSLLVSYLFY